MTPTITLVVASHPDHIQINHHVELMQLLPASRVFEYYRISSQPLWVATTPDVPLRFIPGQDARVLLRTAGLDDEECHDLAGHLPTLLSVIPATLSTAAPAATPPGPFAAVVTDMASMFVCQLHDGVLALLDHKGEREIAPEWPLYFPHHEYKKSSFNKMRVTFKLALMHDLLPKYIAAGQTAAGRYHALQKEAQAAHHARYPPGTPPQKVNLLYDKWKEDRASTLPAPPMATTSAPPPTAQAPAVQLVKATTSEVIDLTCDEQEDPDAYEFCAWQMHEFTIGPDEDFHAWTPPELMAVSMIYRVKSLQIATRKIIDLFIVNQPSTMANAWVAKTFYQAGWSGDQPESTAIFVEAGRLHEGRELAQQFMARARIWDVAVTGD
ncbi:hypothetical protein NLJ89_g10710 [Agrocybe chaxingu]|uniref:Uncharacterized protein n=1 Tax=Agrocybe chaxingu TaxID=84603 RepID=A0A9W8JXM1_9AGAR|nr:hypothetical protein NLJ89_g10710 [Agrocybe chaxingu]